jgi:quinoprotein dehydrogenase-associated probable ABC transporter substrate-binding protein
MPFRQARQEPGLCLVPAGARLRAQLAAHKCDIIMGYPQGNDLVQSTNPYYRTSYALVFKPGRGLDGIETLEDPRLKDKHVGVIAGTPPSTYLATGGLMANANPYPLVIDTRFDSSVEAMIKDLISGEIDAGLLWGPMAGYYAKKANAPLTVVPLTREAGSPALVYRITMGVRFSDQEWKRTLNRMIQENKPAINEILLGSGGNQDSAIARQELSGGGVTWINRAGLIYFRTVPVCRGNM